MIVEAWMVVEHGEPVEVLSRAEVDMPSPGEGEARVEVAANGLNFLDAAICRGAHPVKPELPFVLGAELVGTVVEIGRGVAETALGRRVVAINPKAHGCFAEQVIVPGSAILPVPSSISDEVAASLLVTYQTAHLALHRRARVRPGEWVLVTAAAGGLGTALVQLARAAGARVIACAGSPEKVEVCRAQGAEVAIDYQEEPLQLRVMEATGGAGVDVVCDAVGGEVFDVLLECLAFEGRILPIGWSSGEMPLLEAGPLVARNADLI
ncbi:MAG: NADPH:quinone oxidoreductase family protein, partial [Actinobacteria bacterium]|nr:NADPH:quinone oxidoreductase family protein [Actinomycetota bacterium]